MSSYRTRSMDGRHHIALIILCAFIALSSLAILRLFLSNPEKDSQFYSLERIINIDSRLSREGLAKLKSLPASSKKEQVFQMIGQPMAQLNSLRTAQAGVLDQYAYPLGFAPDTQVVLLFKADTLVGYRFAFNGTVPRKS